MAENLLKSIDPSKSLIDRDGKWKLPRTVEYLRAKKEYLRLLMTGNDLPAKMNDWIC